MTSPPLWHVAVQTEPENEPILRATLEHLFQLPASSFTPIPSRTTTVSIYATTNPGTRSALTDRIHHALAQIQPPTTRPIPWSLSVRRLPARDWTRFWKTHFKPISIGRALLIKPSWNHQSPAPGQKTVILNPELSFGTGHHPTTAFCLQHIARARPRRQPISCLDLGCGSGILAIAAAKLGYAPVLAIDHDPVAIRIAGANARRNRVAHRIRFRLQDVQRLSNQPRSRFDLVCANLSADILRANLHPITRQLLPGATLLLAGILIAEFPPIERLLAADGWILTARRAEAGWCSGRFRGST